MNTPKIVQALAYDAVFSFVYDVTTGLIEKDVTGSNGRNYTREAGLSSPCAFDALADAYLGPDRQRFLPDGPASLEITNRLLMEDYLSGKIRCEYPFYDPVANKHYTVLIFLYQDDDNGHVFAFVVGRALSEKQAGEGNRAKNAFLFNMSHDLRTPMNAIMGYAELLESHWGDLQSARKYLKKLIDSSKLLMSLLDNAIELASLENGRETLKESMGDAKAFHDMLDAIIEHAAREKNVHFSRSVSIMHNNVMCDTMKLRIIFLNILSNALKYTPSGGSIRMSLEELPSGREGYALFKTVVSDTGIGISPEFLPHIFDSFSRERNTSLSGIAGAGLGLPVVKKLVDMMNGSISVKSTPGLGTEVTVIIPHRVVKKEEMLRFAAEKNPSEHRLIAGKRILLAEDNELNAEIAMTILSDAGFLCEHVADGTEAVAAVEEYPDDYYDLILMDIQMPVMDGYQATRTIRQLKGKKSQIPIVAITANALPEDRRLALAAGMNGHIPKPIEITTLLDTLCEILSCP